MPFMSIDIEFNKQGARGPYQYLHLRTTTCMLFCMQSPLCWCCVLAAGAAGLNLVAYIFSVLAYLNVNEAAGEIERGNPRLPRDLEVVGGADRARDPAAPPADRLILAGG